MGIITQRKHLSINRWRLELACWAYRKQHLDAPREGAADAPRAGAGSNTESGCWVPRTGIVVKR